MLKLSIRHLRLVSKHVQAKHGGVLEAGYGGFLIGKLYSFARAAGGGGSSLGSGSLGGSSLGGGSLGSCGLCGSLGCLSCSFHVLIGAIGAIGAIVIILRTGNAGNSKHQGR